MGAVLGAAWLFGDGLLGPAASFGLVVLVASRNGRADRFAAAMSYYAVGSAAMVAAVVGYWGEMHLAIAFAAWMMASLLLAGPWAFASGSRRALLALALTALPPLGCIGWLSPLNGAGVLFPGTRWIGLLLLCCAVVLSYESPSFGHCRLVGIVALVFLIVSTNFRYEDPVVPQRWIGINTHIMPARGDVLAGIENNERAIQAGMTSPKRTQVLFFPEAILDDWREGTRAQFALSVPAGQLWILGADTEASDALVAAAHSQVYERTLTRAAGLTLGGNWLPWGKALQPAWWQSIFMVEQRRVWAALCIEQLQPWTWLEALAQRPDVVVALSNGWWSDARAVRWLPSADAALAIERASTRVWSRLLHSPVVVAVNR